MPDHAAPQPLKSHDSETLSRRQFLKGSLAVAAAASASVVLSSCGGKSETAQPQPQNALPTTPEDKRPNILILMCDEMRFPPVYESDATREYRQKYLQTQNLLDLAGPMDAVTDARADRIIVRYNGEVQTEGTHNQLVKKNELYRRLTEMQLVKV